MARIQITMDKSLLAEIDEYAKKNGYSSRSELIRAAVRKFIKGD